MSGEQKIRSVLFYISVVVFLIGLPFILSFALSYKFNIRTFRFTKAGLIGIKTQPAGASVYLDKKLLKEKTPMTINELLPATYHLRIDLEGYYPWVDDVVVEAGKANRLDKIILFPTLPNIKQITRGNPSSFWLSEEGDYLYYLNEEDNSIYKSDLVGEVVDKIVGLTENLRLPIEWMLSPDGKKMICFNPAQISVINLDPYIQEHPYVFIYPRKNIVDVFWHSDSYHIVVLTKDNVEILEAKDASKPVSILTLNKADSCGFYEISTDSLYFLDSQKAADGKFYDNIYKLELGTKLSSLRDLIKIKPAEQDLNINGLNHKLKQLIKQDQDAG